MRGALHAEAVGAAASRQERDVPHLAPTLLCLSRVFASPASAGSQWQSTPHRHHPDPLCRSPGVDGHTPCPADHWRKLQPAPVDLNPEHTAAAAGVAVHTAADHIPPARDDAAGMLAAAAGGGAVSVDVRPHFRATAAWVKPARTCYPYCHRPRLEAPAHLVQCFAV